LKSKLWYSGGIVIAKANGVYSNRKQSKAIDKQGIVKALNEEMSVRKTAFEI
jgi:hypothetical protein|tara:strand:- start:2560 stop:2715 length:156 start_codon:yes stop_codon:yes gene_type:complete